MKRLFAIVVIWFGCAVAWMMLGSTLVFRGEQTHGDLDGRVGELWGQPIVQSPPVAVATRPRGTPDEPRRLDNDPEDGDDDPNDPHGLHDPHGPNGQDDPSRARVPIVASDIDVVLDLEQRQKGLLWFATYGVGFDARYTFRNESPEPRDVTLVFPLAGADMIYDAFEIVDEHGTPLEANITTEGATWTHAFAGQQSLSFRVVYKSRGTESWSYAASANSAKISNFELRVAVNTPDVDFPAGTISPSEHNSTGGTWNGTWQFDRLVASAPIGIELPKKVNPGPLAAKITFFAPVSLLFFFFVVAVMAAHRRKDIHPMNYLMLGCAFFAFHLLFAYLVDHVSILPSFTISAVVSMVLVTSYARLFVGWRFALIEVGLSQFMYLVLFSFTFFWTGMTGLAVTIGAVLTLFVMMQITGRTRWAEVFGAKAHFVPPPGHVTKTSPT
jgi:hypothetical protein